MAVNTATFNPDGTRVATASDDTSAQSLDVEQPDSGLYYLWNPDHDLVNDVRFSRDGRYVVISHGNRVAVRDSAADSSHPSDPVPQRYEVTSAAFSSNGEFVAVGAGATPTVWAWHRTPKPQGWRWANTPPAGVLDTDKILDVDFGPREYPQLVLTAHADGTARLWDVNERMLVRSLSDPGADIAYQARFSAEGRTIVTAHGDGRVRIWDTSTGRLLRRLEGVGRVALFAVALSPDGTRAAGGGADGTVLVWEVATGKPLALMHSHAGAVNSVEFSPTGGNLILTAGDDGTVKLGPCSTCRPLSELLSMAVHHPT
jgi:WD40 repeat protein